MTSELCSLLFQHAQNRPGEDFWTEFGNERVFLVQSAALSKSILENLDDFPKDMSNVTQISGHSRLTENGYPWQVLLRASQPILANISMNSVCESAIRHTSTAVETLAGTQDEQAPRIDHLVVEEITACVLSDLIFDIDLSVLGPDVVRDVSRFMQYIKRNTPYSGSFARKHGAEEFRDLGNLRLKWLKRFSNLPEAAQNSKFFKRVSDAVAKPEVSATLEQEVLFFLSAGSETSAATISWAMLLLADNPLLQSELRTVLDEYWIDGKLDFRSLLKDGGLASFLREVMCCYPPVPMVVRSPDKDVCLANHDIRQDNHVIVSLLGMGHGQSVKPNGKGIRLHDLTNTPGDLDNLMRFGSGPRKCGGQRMAMAEVSVALACLIRNFQFVRTPNEAVRFSWQLSMTCEDGVPVTLSKLQPS
ncbi:cytochrome P450 [Anderseniella sp. Alg231-50]|uniref:cytochrome P450 n=1 Tax=Anderseniella sp. Alg231-50 TaxID=1922226 RepID=UPI000D55CEAC